MTPQTLAPPPRPRTAPRTAPAPASASPDTRPEHLFTVDVEEWFQVAALEGAVGMARWERMESRLQRSVDVLLEMMDRHGARGTFFTLGWVAQRHAAIVCRIAAAGHEVASHGWSHRRVTSLRPREFRDEVRRSRDLLQDLSGQAVVGYRAPNFSIVPGWQWAFDLLLDEGYRYDSSIFPSRRSGLGAHPPHPHPVERTGGTLLEVPLGAARFGRWSVPAAGGAWFRLFPYALTRRALRQAERRGAPGVFYLHPWEIDPEQPRLRVGPLTRIRHYGGLAAATARLERLLREFRFGAVADRLGLRAPARPAAREA